MANTDSGGSAAAGVSQYLVAGNAGDIIFSEGDASAEVYVIQEGRVELMHRNGPDLVQVAVLEAGDFFGEMSALDGTLREVTARAASAFTALRLDRTTVVQLARENPEIPLRMLARAARRLHAHREAEWRAARAAAESSKKAEAGPTPAPDAGTRAPQTTPTPAPEPRAEGAASFVHEASGTEFPIPQGRTSTVGRPDRASGYTPDINLTAIDPNRTCGRRHACIVWRDGAYRVLDETGKGNGSFVNDVRVETGVETALADGDHVRFGLVELTFRRR